MNKHKYILRSDILFERRPALLTSSIDQKAYSIYREAELLAEDGKVDESIGLFRKAFRMSPELSIIMGQG